MNLTRRITNFPTKTTTAVLLAAFLMAGTAVAIDQPPQEPDQLRAWLVGHLVTDMEALGTFDGTTLAKVPSIVNALTDDQVALLSQYYFLTRSKTQQDAYLYSLQQQGNTDEQVNAAKAEVADLLTTMNDQTVACYDQFAPMPEPVQYLAQICYASVPGWCCHARCYVPEWYYDNGSYVGPCFDAAYAGDWAGPVCNAYYDHGSGFYARYHNVDNTVYARRSIRMAHRHADRLRNHGDWKSVMAHDRLVHHLQNGSHHQPNRLHTSTQNHVGKHALAAHNPHAAAARTGSNHARIGNHKAAVHNQKHKAGSRKVARSPKAHRQAGKAHGNHSSAAHQPKAHRQGGKPHANRASAPHPRASRPAAHASHPRPAAHAAHSRPAAHAQAHAKSGGHGKHH